MTYDRAKAIYDEAVRVKDAAVAAWKANPCDETLAAMRTAGYNVSDAKWDLERAYYTRPVMVLGEI